MQKIDALKYFHISFGFFFFFFIFCMFVHYSAITSSVASIITANESKKKNKEKIV